MDLREQLPPHHQHQHQHQHHPQPPPGMTANQPPNSYNAPNTPNLPNATTINTNSSPMLQNPRFPFHTGPPKPMDSLNLPYGDGSHLVSPPQPPSGFGIESGGKKKRGRPRKYSPDSNIALGLAPSPSPVTPVTGGTSALAVVAHGDSGGVPVSSSDPTQGGKRSRGRPPGSGKKQLDALGSFGVSFTPHVILVKAGEDIASKIMAFSQQGPRTVCILSANGAVSNITLRQPAMSGGNVTYEGRFEIISLSGSFVLSESNGSRSRTGALSVSLAGSDGRVLGGGVAGMLVAATPVQVIVGSFIADGKKSKSGPPSAPMSNVLNFSEPVAAESPPSQGHSSESSDENGGSPFNRVAGPYNNASQPVHGSTVPMYSMGWGNSM